MDKVFLSIPTYNGQMSIGTAQGAFLFPTKGKYHMIPACGMDSLLAHGFNSAWATALNMRKEHEIKYFAMLHADIGPSRFWLDVLIDELKRTKSDVISCVIPIKDEKGLTSTGLDNRNEKTRMLRRLTMTEVMDLPETFGAKDTCMPDAPLLINTGCWVCDFTQPWVEKVRFQVSDMIGRSPDGEFVAIADPEDWDFSRQLHKHGLKVMATRKVQIDHVGSFKFSNNSAWGTWKHDQTFMNANEHRQLAVDAGQEAPVYEQCA
jgi:hypothetical protein